MPILLLLAAIALDTSLMQLQRQDARVAAISWRLQTANAALCHDQAFVTGLTVHALSQYRDNQRAAATAQFGLRDRVAISAVAPRSAADRAGLMVGDEVLAIDGAQTPAVLPGSGYGPVGRTETMIDTAFIKQKVMLRIARGGLQRDVEVTGERGCASQVQIVAGGSINAQADGRYVQINAAMLDFAESDDALAVIIGHELAHNILRHADLKTPSKRAEYEADRVGVWLMARAGYDVDAVVPFWTRFERRTNAGIFADGSHPSPRKRIAAVTAAVSLFKTQRAAGEPLVPGANPVAQ